MNDSTRRATRFFIALVTCVAFSSIAFASKDEDRDTAGLQKLGIGNSFGRWPGGVVQWVYNPTGRSAYFSDDNEFVNLLMEAMTEIENASGVDFQYLGIDSAAVIGNFADSIVTIGWENLNGAAGVAGPASSCNGATILAIGYCQYVDGSVRFNNDINDVNWDKGDAETSENGLIQVAMHEILHLLGIGHSDIPESIMYANPYTNLSHLHDDDLDALRSMYGPSSTPADPPQYTPPAAGAGDPLITDFFIATQNSIGTPISTVGDGEPAAFVGLSWKKLNGDAPDITFVAEDPAGFYYTMRVDTRDCTAGPGFICTFWASAFSTATLQTYPGIWRIHAMVNGNLIESNDLDVQFTPPVLNEAPDAGIMFDVTSGPGPLTVNATLTVTGDAEGDDISATWHVPTYGQLASTVSTGGGVDQRQFTFNQDGDYEIYVVVNDDWVRYGTPGSGAEAGPGFRRLFRQVIQVGVAPQLPKVPLLLRRSDNGRWHGYELDGSDISNEGGVDLTFNLAWQVKAVDDFDGDNRDDVLMRRTDNQRWYMYLLNGLNIVEEGGVFLATSPNWNIASVGDYNGDGRSDLLMRNGDNRHWRIRLMDGRSILETGPADLPLDLSWDVVASRDFDGDGADDILIRNSVNGRWKMYLMNGTSIKESALLSLAVVDIWLFQAADDFTGDGQADVLVRRSDNGLWRLYTMNGTLLVSTDLINLPTGASWRLESAHDFNADGRTDVLLRNTVTEQWQLNLLNGPTVSASGMLAIPANPSLVLQVVDDFDADNDADLLTRNSVNGQWKLYSIDGTAIQAENTVSMTTNLAWELVLPKSQ